MYHLCFVVTILLCRWCFVFARIVLRVFGMLIRVRVTDGTYHVFFLPVGIEAMYVKVEGKKEVSRNNNNLNVVLASYFHVFLSILEGGFVQTFSIFVPHVCFFAFLDSYSHTMTVLSRKVLCCLIQTPLSNFLFDYKQ